MPYSNASSSALGAMPAHIELWTRIGLDEFRTEDRITALRAADAYDQQHATEWGRKVVGVFMEQMGLEFAENSSARFKAYSRRSVSGEEKENTELLTRAIGSHIGIKHVHYEGIDKTDRTLALVHEPFGNLYVERFPTERLETYRESRPYTMYRLITGSESISNFDKARQGLLAQFIPVSMGG